MKKTALTLILFLVWTPAVAQQAPPSFLNTVAVGDSLMAGFISGSLVEHGQIHSPAYLVSRQVGTFMFLPLITEPGIPNELMLVDPGPPPVILPVEGTGATRLFPLIVTQNLAVPGQDTAEALTVRPELPLDALEDTILGVPILLADLGIPPLSQIELAFALQPTFTLFWLGSNETLGAALAGDPSLVTPFAEFQVAYQTAVGTVLAAGSDIVVANIPDVTVIPFLTSAEELAALVGVPLPAIGPALGIAEGDFVTALGVPLVAQILGGAMPGPLPGNVVLTAAEVTQIQTATAQMNAFIDGLAANFGFPVVDVNTKLNELDQNGAVVDGVTLTTTILGGLFSLDGIHPTHTGNAIVANWFIDAINAHWGLPIPPVDVAAILAEDPLVFSAGQVSGVGLPSAMTMEVSDFIALARVLVPPTRLVRAEEGGQPGIEKLRLDPGDYHLSPGPVSAGRARLGGRKNHR